MLRLMRMVIERQIFNMLCLDRNLEVKGASS